MFIRSRFNRTARVFALLTLVCCVFWNTVGISTHNHDLVADVGSPSLHDVASRSPVPQYAPVSVVASAVDNDICPACSYDAACVSGAISAFVLPQFPAAAITIPTSAVTLHSLPSAGAMSRGPPAA
ncbi:MAG: hypothetical protein P4L33_09755 [Capsulimonadaceae bacterium]|nr:hypothetical protein [Capsulimonadaceae bacterium]